MVFAALRARGESAREFIFRLKGIAMLCLSRRLNETIVIGHHIRVTVARVRGKKVVLRIDAPRDVNIRRGELEERDATGPVADAGH